MLAALLAMAGCASGNPPGDGNSAGNGSSMTASPPLTAGSTGSPSGSSQMPGPAPSDSDGLQVSGPVSVSLLSRSGPLQPAGPYLGTDVASLLGQYRAALGGSQPGCPTAGCWADARVPSGSLLLAVRPEVVACYQVTHVRTAQSGSTLEVDLQLNYVCRVGAGTAARMASWLFALPASAVPAGSTVTVRVSPRPGVSFSTLGSVKR